MMVEEVSPSKDLGELLTDFTQAASHLQTSPDKKPIALKKELREILHLLNEIDIALEERSLESKRVVPSTMTKNIQKALNSVQFFIKNQPNFQKNVDQIIVSLFANVEDKVKGVYKNLKKKRYGKRVEKIDALNDKKHRF